MSEEKLEPSVIYRYPLDLQDTANNGMMKITIKERRDRQVMKHIFLPAPSGFNISDGANFSNFERGQAAMALEVGKRGFQGFMEGGLDGAAAATGIGSRGANDIAGGVAAFAADTAAAGLLGFGGLPAGAGIAAQETAFMAGAAIDKGARSRFQDNALRKFNVSIQMSPKNEAENKQINKIIKLLRGYTYANLGSNTFALDYPPEMLIEFYHGPGKIRNKFMPVLMPSYIESLSTTYNPNTFALHADGGMEQYDLALSFGEIKRLTRNELETLETDQLEDDRHNELYKEQQLSEAAAKAAADAAGLEVSTGDAS